MSFILTFVASDTPLTAGHLAVMERYIDENGIGLASDPFWQAEHKAGDIPVADKPEKEHIHEIRQMLAADRIDFFVTPRENRRKKLLLADMDSTIVTGETLDAIARHAGIGEKVAAITKKAMNGEIDFAGALRERVALLKDFPAETLETVLGEESLSPGAQTLVKTMARAGAKCVLVSGGFTFFTENFARRAGFDHHHGNILEIEDGMLTGKVTEPIQDKNTKHALLMSYTQELQLNRDDSIALGDGANDLPMLQAAGIGIGYRPKKLLLENLDNVILYGDLTAALFAQGYRAEEFVTE